MTDNPMGIQHIRRNILTAAAGCTLAVLTLLSCSGLEPRNPGELKFIIIGNTNPASPFTGHPEKLMYVIKSINQENAFLVIHTGNIIQGGTESVGITARDITRQFGAFARDRGALRAILHILAGEKDLYNGSLDMFNRYTGEKLFYSFNYGPVHFVLLNILNKKHSLSPEQVKWLKRDLEDHRNDSAIFIFSHFPIQSSPQSGVKYLEGEELHDLFKEYPVKAAISGYSNNLNEFEKDGIRYINAGCFGYNYEEWHWNFNQYYIAHFDGTRLTVKGIRVNFPADSYRPKIIKDDMIDKSTGKIPKK